MSWWRDKSPGLKILWLWTFGTAAVLVTSVVRTRIKDMDNFTNATDDHQQQQKPEKQETTAPDADDTLVVVESYPHSDQDKS